MASENPHLIEQLRAALDTVEAGVLVTDSQRAVVHANPAVVALLGYPEGTSLEGIPSYEVVRRYARTTQDQSAVFATIDALADNRQPGASRHVLEDGRTVLVRFVPQLDPQGRRTGVVWVVEEQTEPAALANVWAEEGGTPEELDQLVDQRREFIAAAAHELRTPLTTVLGYCGLLESLDGSEKLSPGQAAMIGAVHRNALRIGATLENLMQATRLDPDAIRLRREPVDLAALVARCCADLSYLAVQRQIWIEVDCTHGPLLDGDPVRLEEVTANLVSNAFKFTDAGGSVSVSVRYDAGEDVWRLMVADTGRGIPTAELRRLGQSFFRASNAEDVGGAGLGLAITQADIEAHGGSLRIDSVEGGGTSVRVSLPVGGEPA